MIPVSLYGRYMLGTEQGLVISCDRKAKSPRETFVSLYPAHHGPVYSVQRNPVFTRNFLTVGDYCARIWSEDITDSSILRTGPSAERLTEGRWSPVRPSVFLTTKMDGAMDVWDVIFQHRAPILSHKVRTV